MKMFKRMGLSSEQVCALGDWKNSTAFDEHYSRLNTCDTARTVAENLLGLVHRVSPGEVRSPTGRGLREGDLNWEKLTGRTKHDATVSPPSPPKVTSG